MKKLVEQDILALYSRPGCSIGEAAKLVGLPESTLRYWEELGLIRLQRPAGGKRFYTEEVLQEIRQLKAVIQGKHLKATDVAILLTQ